MLLSLLLILYHLSIIAASFIAASSDGYAPVKVSCPGGQLTRSSTTGLNPDEQSYINSRYQIAKQNLATFLNDANLKDFDVSNFLNNANPTIGLAFSGGGYRAQLCGAGQYAALDSRTNVVNGKGLGGILQSSSYISGLSGGAWLVGSLVSNNLISIDDLINQNSLWQTEHSILSPSGNFLKDIGAYFKIGEQVHGKESAGFDVTITDIWGRALSYQLLANSPNNGAGSKFSDIINQPNFQNHYSPLPILVADGRAPGTSVINLNSTVFSITPFEVGSESPSLQSFVQTKYLGTELDNGYPVDSSTCINSFDNAGFLFGTSSSLFNGIILTLGQTKLPNFITDLINKFAVDPFEKLNVDVANYSPNPFYKSSNPDTSIAKSKTLYLVDGGEDGQNVPLDPLLHRNLSTIFAFDNSADNLQWPDGTSLVKTYERQFSAEGKNSAFPYVPDSNTFRNLNLTAKPTFFGCDAKNLTGLADDVFSVPLVIYFANRPYSYWSNTSTFKLEYDIDERNSIISNGFAVASRLNGTIDLEWNACVGCAIIRREQERLGHDQTDQCKKCFQKYCWDGTIYQGNPIGDNFDESGLTVVANDYTSNSIPGFFETGPNLKKRE
ncbi:uncharacterized protein KGF55_002912 [Candida pseudojiufengensis]|uniref:uncharacterized protein n=1 Tax=Candida pseudojiufengensis TaxID=497109 RepID=UPI002224C97E|nr:uncharacterized protein KGF55_002912 [Candida pseudojiufengensis]KAI5963120.1 hypothetical protein KGF55_002912 [Candida pseudojiufengensis]